MILTDKKILDTGRDFNCMYEIKYIEIISKILSINTVFNMYIEKDNLLCLKMCVDNFGYMIFGISPVCESVDSDSGSESESDNE